MIVTNGLRGVSTVRAAFVAPTDVSKYAKMNESERKREQGSRL
jgi:hypothetical protein